MAQKDKLADQFKNIGIDTDFIKTHADEHNKKVNAVYYNYSSHKKEQFFKEPESVVQEPKKEEQRPKPVVQESEIVNLEQLKLELQAYADQKILELAQKMQAFADQTDAKLDQLAQQIGSHSQNPQPQQQKAEPVQETLQQPTSSKPPSSEQHNPHTKDTFKPEDVEIGKMFNFSNNPSGKIQR
ncbi:MAG: hypothetical protein ACMXYF_04295 [Candidatus Woesearchaeota archaeon]